MLNNQINVEIQNKDGLLVVSSQVIARELNKEHKRICNKIKEILEVWPNLATPPKSNFEAIEITSINTQNNQEYKEYLLSEEGYTLLVMNFTGYNDFKRAYIKEFKRMREQELKTPVIQENRIIKKEQNLLTHSLDENGFYLYPLTCAAAPSQLRYKIIKGTIYFKLSDIDRILGVSRRDFGALRRDGDTRTATNYTIHHILADIGITPYSFDYLLSIWQILELCNHIKSRRSELLENILCYKVKPFFEKELKRLIA